LRRRKVRTGGIKVSWSLIKWLTGAVVVTWYDTAELVCVDSGEFKVVAEVVMFVTAGGCVPCVGPAVIDRGFSDARQGSW
jgi:hypothetical protein